MSCSSCGYDVASISKKIKETHRYHSCPRCGLKFDKPVEVEPETKAESLGGKIVDIKPLLD